MFTLAHIKYVKLKKVKVTKIANKRALKIYAFKCEILGTKVTNKIAFKIQKLSIKMNAGTDIASKLEKKIFLLLIGLEYIRNWIPLLLSS
ncbi:hypothetical protein MSATCC14277_5260 [Metamycoplasma salivarium]|nr:hypothetical protein MSATCC14277_5260 [Metamycoplasma salivarium]GIZ06507.1 hypothetical protein MSATCC23557_4790 [Metamycoplasma salivarium]GIZ07227.1 hypothetical protein MSATCC33130_5810 [Metamycoplasma salivarium]